MEKPSILVLNEFREQVVDLINSTNLPVFVKRYALEEILQGVRQAEKIELEQAKQSYGGQDK